MGNVMGRKGGKGRGRRAKKHGTRKDEGDEPFPLMLVPVELIVVILSFLPTADRFRARVNRTIYKLEENEQYYVSEMGVACKGGSVLNDSPLQMALDGPRSRYIEGLRKLAKNVSFGWVLFECYEPNRELIPYIKTLRSDTLFVTIYREPLEEDDYVDMPDEECNDESLDAWIGDRKGLTLYSCCPLSGERLYSLYLEMESGRSSLVQSLFGGPKQAESNKLLRLIGITYVNGRFHSTRNDVKVYVWRKSAREEDDHQDIHDILTPNHHFFIVLGRMLVAVRKWTVTVTEDVVEFEQNQLILERHNEDGSLPKARSDLGFSFFSIADIRNRRTYFKRLPVVYEN